MKNKRLFTVTLGLAMILALGPLASVGLADAGDLDTSFNITGLVLSAPSGSDEAVAVDVQSDGKIVVAAASLGSFASTLARYDTDGSPDTSASIPNVKATDMVIQPDGKIVVVGYVDNSAGGQMHDFFVGRFNSDLSPDPTLQATIGLFDGSDDQANAVALQSDGGIVVVGYSNFNAHDQFAWLRYNSDGMLDTAIGDNGRVTTDLAPLGGPNARILDVAVQSEDKIVTVGYADNGTTDDPVIARYLGTGILDTSFGINGLWFSPNTTFDGRSTGVTVQTDDKIVTVGYLNYTGTYDFVISRLNAGGSFDTSFGTSGAARANFSGGDDRPQDVVVQSDDKIVVVGYTTPSGETTSDLALARLDSGGALDTGFGTNGLVTTDIATFGKGDDKLYGADLQSDDKILVAGSTVPEDGSSYSFVLARYESETATGPRPPNTPSHPVPPDGATDVALNPLLLWLGGDPDGDPVTYTVSFGDSSPPPVVTTTLQTSYLPGTLAEGTRYYWQITASDGVSESVGSTWTFTTTMPRLQVFKTVDTGGLSEVPLGGVVTYTVVISNPTSSVEAGVVMTDPLPSAIDAITWLEQGSARLPAHTIEWGPHDVLTDTSYTLRFAAHVSLGTAFLGTDVVNTAYLTGTDADPDSDSATFSIASGDFFIYLPVVIRNG